MSTHQPTSSLSLAELLDDHREWYDQDCGIFEGCSCSWDNGTEKNNDGYTEHLASVIQSSMGYEALAKDPEYLEEVEARKAFRQRAKDYNVMEEKLANLRAYALGLSSNPDLKSISEYILKVVG